MALTAYDLQGIAKLVGLAIDERNLATKSFTQEYLDEALANFRMSLSKDIARLATKEDLRLGLEETKKELKEYVHEVGNQIVEGFSETMEQHLLVHHGKASPATH